MMQKLIGALLSTAAGGCVDDPFYFSRNGQPCSFYNGTDCSNMWSSGNIARLFESCPAACASCVRANDFCEIGLGGDVLDVGLAMKSFDLIDQPFLNQPCDWMDSPEGLMQTSNAWGNFPGENVSLSFFLLRRRLVVMKNVVVVPERGRKNIFLSFFLA